jgi:hypothetical protein
MQSSVFGLIHDTHPAAAKLFDDAVVRDGLAEERRRLRHSAVILGCLSESSQRDDTASKAGIRVGRSRVWRNRVASTH